MAPSDEIRTVDAYVEAALPEQAAALRRFRAICLAALPGWTERLAYGMPGYGPPEGEVAVAFAGQRRGVALYILKKPVLDAYRDRFPPSRVGKGSIRYPDPSQIDYALVEALVRASFAADAPVC